MLQSSTLFQSLQKYNSYTTLLIFYIIICYCPQDLGENPNSGFITITIRVSDVDDMDPVFEPATYLSSIPENSTFVSLSLSCNL